jgi:hypothetical protein
MVEKAAWAGGAVETGGPMEREDDGRSCPGVVEIPVGKRPDAVENARQRAEHGRGTAVSFFFLRNYGEWRAF